MYYHGINLMILYNQDGGKSRVVMLELEQPNTNSTVSFVAQPNLNGKVDNSQL